MRARWDGLKQVVRGAGAQGIGLGRSAYFLAQARALQALTSVAVKGGFPSRTRDRGLQKKLISEAFSLLRQDSNYFADGTFPMGLLAPGNPLSHSVTTARMLVDGLRLIRQKRLGRTAVFSAEAREKVSDKPRYYQRNFHFQEDGYLSDRSAELYEHQVEVLFVGTGDMMRRLALQALVEKLGRPADTDGGRGFKILEVAAGTGCTSRMIKQLYPRAQLTVSDLSEVYLKRARSGLAEFERVDFVEAAGESLPFSDGHFDAVVSVYLFHELPLEVRKAVLAESRRVARPGGWVIGVDSLQEHDIPEFLPILEQFPRDFHEPFYRNYIGEPLERLFEQAGMAAVEHRTGFISKLVLGQAVR